MPRVKVIKEAGVIYETVVANLDEALVLEHEGKPVAVVLPYDRYQRLLEMAERSRSREEAWQELDELLAQVHSRLTSLSPDEIEAEITAASAEAREARYGKHRGRH